MYINGFKVLSSSLKYISKVHTYVRMCANKVLRYIEKAAMCRKHTKQASPTRWFAVKTLTRAHTHTQQTHTHTHTRRTIVSDR